MVIDQCIALKHVSALNEYNDSPKTSNSMNSFAASQSSTDTLQNANNWAKLNIGRRSNFGIKTFLLICTCAELLEA